MMRATAAIPILRLLDEASTRPIRRTTAVQGTGRIAAAGSSTA
jgi:hypothetical protein